MIRYLLDWLWDQVRYQGPGHVRRVKRRRDRGKY